MKLKLILIIIFTLTYSLFFYINTKNTQQMVDIALEKQINNLEIQYSLTKSYFINDAQSIRNNISNNNKIIEIFSKAQNATKEQRDVLRKKLHNVLVPIYRRIQTRGILQFQFVFKNNISFLRMHKSNKYGDDLTEIRYSFKYANENQKTIEGFEQGRTTHAFRYVFPFYDKAHNHLGAIEISLSSLAMQEKLISVSKIHSHFLVHKDIFDAKAWKVKTDEKKYIQSIEHEDYYYAITKHSNKQKLKRAENIIMTKVKKSIREHMLEDKPFAVYTSLEESVKIVAFFPIKNIENKKVVAYVASYTDDDNLYHTLRNSKIINILIFVSLLLLFYFLYRNLHYKIELQQEVKEKTSELEDLNNNLEHIVEDKTQELKSLLSSYDKNVMYSSTDLDGIITDVSEAFCKMSGYTQEELIGTNHNIVRHPDNSTDLYKKLWKHLKENKSFTTEIKNLKKNGDYFWVTSFFDSKYDRDGNHVGYTCVRDNITDKKEVEALHQEVEDTQKEVIYTMGAIGETRSKETGNHVRRVAEYSKLLALKYGLPEAEAELLKQASPMHDIGKVGIPDDILNKPAKLTDNEMTIMKTHSKLGFDMLHGSTRPLLNTATIVAYEHHEKWDGSGYPQGLTALEIHIYGRITAVADVFDALGSDRCYKKAWNNERIFKFFKEQRGKHFEPKLVDIFFDNLDEFLEIRDKLND